MKKLKLSFTALLCLLASTAFLQTFESIDVLSWNSQVGLSGFTPGGTTWDANGNAANDCDGDGFYGLQNGAFVINGWEGTCGCDCGPDDPSSNCGRNDSQMDIIVAPGLIGSYCSVRIQIPVSASPTLECGTNNDQDPEDVTVDQCMEDLGAWAGTDFMIITYDVLKSDASREVVTEKICGNSRTGLIERTFDDAQFIQITIQGGTQEVDEFYEIGDIVIDGVLKELSALSIFAINHTNGFICENSALPLILQTNADLTFDFIWTGPNGFVSTDAIVQVSDLDPNMSGVYSVQVTDSNGCIATGETNISVRPASDAECTSSPEFNLFGIICSDQDLPLISDNGISGTWSPGSDLNAYAGQTLEFTFNPTDPNVSTYQITLEVDDLDRLEDFAIQPDPTPVFCNVSSTRYDLINIFQMNLDLSLTVNGEDDIFFFIDNNETVQQVEAQMRSISFEGITPGNKTFFIDAVSPCGEFNQLSFNFVVLGDTDPIVIDTTLCIGEPFSYLGIPISQDTVMNSGECGGGIEINITREGPRQRNFPLVGSFCITDKVYVYDTLDMDGNQVGLTTEFFPEYENAIDTIFSESTNTLYTLPFPASNGCDSLVELVYTWPSSDNIEYKIFDLCANKDTLVQAGTREWLVSASTPFHEIRINCFSSIIIDANILPVEVDSVVSTFCADQDTLIEDFDGQMILFNRDNPTATFFAEVGANGCAESKVVELTFVEPTTAEVNEIICLGESVIVGNQVFTSTTVNQEVVLSRQSSTGCDSIVMVNVEVIDAQISNANLTCDDTEIQLSATHNGTILGWTGPNGFNSVEESPSISEPGLYTVSIEGPSGCVSEFSESITQDIIPPSLELFGGVINCNNNGELSLSLTTDGTLLEWRGPSGFVSDDMSPTVSVAGTYEAEVIGANGCTTVRTLEVTEDLVLPVGTTVPGEISCNSNNRHILDINTTEIFIAWSGPDGFVSTNINAEVTAPGTYQATIRGQNGCETTIDLEVTEDISLPTLSADDLVIDCNTSLASLNATTDGTITGWTGPDGFTSIETAPMINNAGSYTVTAIGANGCESTITLEVSVDTSIVEITAENLIVDCNTTEVSLAATTVGTVLGWTGPAGFSSSEVSPMASMPGTYEVTVIGDNGCENIATLELSEDLTLPQITVADLIVDCNNPTVTLTATTDGTILGWIDEAGQSIAGDTPPVDVAGVYTVESMGANGCVNQATITVSEDLALPEASALGGELNCLNNQTLSLTLDIVSGQFVSWSGPNSFTSDVLNADVIAPGIYQAVVRGDNGCEIIVDAVVNENLIEPVVTAAEATITCQNNGEVQLNAVTDDNIIEWTGPDGFQSADVAPMVSIAGTYSVRVQGINGCESVVDMLVTEDVTPVDVQALSKTVDCNNIEVTLEATTGGTILNWTGPNGFMSTEVNPLISEPGDYTVTIIGANGCENTAIATITEDNELPEVSADDIALDCNLTETALSATTVSTITGWTGPNGFVSTESAPLISEAGQYIVTVLGANGCENTSTVTVSIDDQLPTLSALSGVLNCANNQEVMLEASSDASVVSWSGPGGFSSDQLNPIVALPGSYTITAASDNGCDVSETIEITEDIIAPVVSTTNDQLSCSNDATVSLMFDSEATFLRWEGPGGFTSSESTPEINVPGTYTVFVQGANGCTNSTTAVISGDSDIPTATPDVTEVLTCEVTSVRLSATSDADIISWTDPSGSVLTDISPVVSVPGTYTVTVEAASGCQGFASIEVVEDVAPPAIAGDNGNINCNSANFVLSVTTDGNIRGWRGPNGFVSTDDSPTVDMAGTYEVEVEGANGCIGLMNIEVAEDFVAPTISTSTTSSVACQSAGAQLLVTTDESNIAWIGPNGFSSNELDPMVFESGAYSVTVTGQNGCTTTENIDISFTELEIEIGEVIGSCEGVANGMLVLQNVSGATPPFTLTGVGGQTIQVESFPFSLEALATGDYNLEVSTPSGCTDQIMVNIPEDRDATLAIDVSTIDPLGEYDLALDYDGTIAEVIWQATPGLSCLDCPNPMVSISESSTFSVSIVDEEGCLAEAQVSLTVNDIENIYVPNVMSSHSVSGNDRFYPQGNFSQTSNFDMMIFDRWGNKVYESFGEELNDPNSGWDGRFNGNAANSGVYVYSIEVYNEFGARKVIKGDITLVR